MSVSASVIGGRSSWATGAVSRKARAQGLRIGGGDLSTPRFCWRACLEANAEESLARLLRKNRARSPRLAQAVGEPRTAVNAPRRTKSNGAASAVERYNHREWYERAIAVATAP